MVDLHMVDGVDDWDEGRRRAEMWTWLLLAEIAQRSRVQAVFELHPGGGMYDTIEFRLETERGVVRGHCNRPGRVHLPGDGNPVRNLLRDVDHGLSPGEAATWVVETARAATGPSDTPVAASLQAMADGLATGVGSGDGRTWRWRAGWLDSPGYSSGRREVLFDAVPAAREACDRSPRLGDLEPEYGYWFLVADDLVVMAVEPATGRLFVGEESFVVDGPDAEDRWRQAVRAVSGETVVAGPTITQARAAFGPVADRLASQLVGPVQPFVPAAALTRKASWYLDQAGGSLVVVVGPHEQPDVCDEVLSYALAWQGDRDLLMVVPETHLGLLPGRAAWLGVPLRLFAYGRERLCRPVVVPSRAETLKLSAALPLRGGGDHSLGAERAAWVAVLIDGADQHWALIAAHRSSYLAWHCAGRQVLRISRSGSGLRVLAGVNHVATDSGDPALEVVLDGPLPPAVRAAVEARMAEAVRQRLSGSDSGHAEHRLQAALAGGPMPEKLGLVRVVREYPAWRGPGRPGYIDFLGIDAAGQLHVVETKVGHGDVAVVLQALDYAVWIAAHAGEIRQELRRGADPQTERVVIDFVLAPKGGQPAVGPYLVGQLESLARDVAWRVSVVGDAAADLPDMTAPARRDLPPPGVEGTGAVAPLRWANRCAAPMNAPARLAAPSLYGDPQQGVIAAAAAAYQMVKDAGRLHRWAASPRSSQVFGINLFGPLDQAGIAGVFALMGVEVAETEPAVFEYSDPEDALGEGPFPTQVDVVLRGTDRGGERHLALIEVKFSETDFGSCGSWESPANPWPDNCRTSGMFGHRPDRCYALTGHGHGHRRYEDYIGHHRVAEWSDGRASGGCAVRGGLYQPMRTLALAGAILERNEADRVIYVLCAPAGNSAVWRRMSDVERWFPDSDERVTARLEAEDVAPLHPDGGAAFFERYPTLGS